MDLGKMTKIKSKTGRKNGLFMMLDLNVVGSTEEDLPRFYIHTLSPFTDFRNGSYALSSLKKVSGTDGFLSIPDAQKQCQLGEVEDCNNAKFIEQVANECKCRLWVLDNNKEVCLKGKLQSLQDLPHCTAAAAACLGSLPVSNDACTVACTGLYADVSVEDRFSDDVAKGRLISVLTFCFRAESTFLGGFWKSN